VQGFTIHDADGLMTTTLQTVGLRRVANAAVSVDYYLRSTGWESDDNARIWVTDGSTEIDLLNTAGSDIDDLGIEGAWITLTASLAGLSSATLSFELDSNASNEALYLDNIVFTGDAAVVPIPAAAWLFLPAFLSFAGFRRQAIP
jgi:hypothetical protein